MKTITPRFYDADGFCIKSGDTLKSLDTSAIYRVFMNDENELMCRNRRPQSGVAAVIKLNTERAKRMRIRGSI